MFTDAFVVFSETVPDLDLEHSLSDVQTCLITFNLGALGKIKSAL